MSKDKFIKIAKKSAAIQIAELKKINKIINKSFISAMDLISNCKGKVIFSGHGKSGLIARKCSATFSSVGIPSFYIEPSNISHGDSGAIERKDILIVLSYSGNTSELTSILKYANRFGIKIIGCASKADSMLLKASDIKIILPKVREADLTGLVPTSSTSISLLYFDTLCVALQNKMKFSRDKFKRYHSGGNIGQTLLLVKDIMTTGKKLPLINPNKTIEEAIKTINSKKLGLVVVAKNKFVQGILVDGQVRRGIKNYSKNEKVRRFMTKNPVFINENSLASKALSIMNEKKITSLLVKDESQRGMKLKGIIHIHDLLNYGIKWLKEKKKFYQFKY
mgnify:CR=1 FL=1